MHIYIKKIYNHNIMTVYNNNNINENNNNVNNTKYINNTIAHIEKNSNPKTNNKLDRKCAPGLTYEAGSCARLTVLIELAKAYNYSAQPNDMIPLMSNFEILNPQKYKKYLVHEIEKRVGDKCTTQKCWSTQEFVKYMENKAKEELAKYTFRPESPEGKFEWLSTININEVMKQYENKYKDFKFFGAVPMDFADLSHLEICNANYDKYKKEGKTKLGVIFNLDDHDQKGSHWVAMFTDLEKGNVFYFDSFAVNPEPRVRTLIRKQTNYMLSNGKTLDDIRTDSNKIQHQKGNSECGVYSMNFIIKMLKGDDFDKLCKNPIIDKKMNKCRRVYFDKSNKK